MIAPRPHRAWGQWRFAVGTGAIRIEVTCAASEVDVVAAWLAEHGIDSQALPLPVPEHVERVWARSYRWTALAWDQYERRAFYATLLSHRCVRGAA